MKVTKEHLRDTCVAIGKGLLQHNATREELKDIFHAKSGSIINTCFNDLIAAYEDSPENAMLSAVIQEALTMSTQEYTTLRTLLCYHHNADTNKTVRNELARGVPVPRLSTSKENLQFKREKCPGIVSLICLRGGELKLGAFADLDPDDPYTKPVGARRKLLELLFSEVEMYSHFFQYPLQADADGIYRLHWVRFIDGSNIKDVPFTISSLHCATLDRHSRATHNQVPLWKIGAGEGDDVVIDMIGVEEGEWAEIAGKTITHNNKNFVFTVENAPDRKMASSLHGMTGSAGNRPLVGNNIHKDDFGKLDFYLGDDGTKTYEFHDWMENYFKVRTWLQDTAEKRKNLSEAANTW